MLRGNLRFMIALVTALCVLLAVVTCQLFSIVYERFSRGIAVRHLLGHGWLRTFRDPLAYWLALSLVEAGVGLLLNGTGLGWVSSFHAGPGMVLALAVGLTIIQLAVASLMLTILSRRRLAEVLNKEF